MNWTHIWNNGTKHSLTHLRPFSVKTMIDNTECEVRVTFGLHTFTDNKEKGDPITHRGETRWFCSDRYQCSKDLPGVIKQGLLNHKSYVRPYINNKKKECYFYLDVVDYGLFIELRKPPDKEDYLKLHVVSAYDINTWGRSGLPRNKPVRFSYILAQKLLKKPVLSKK